MYGHFGGLGISVGEVNTIWVCDDKGRDLTLLVEAIVMSRLCLLRSVVGHSCWRYEIQRDRCIQSHVKVIANWQTIPDTAIGRHVTQEYYWSAYFNNNRVLYIFTISLIQSAERSWHANSRCGRHWDYSRPLPATNRQSWGSRLLASTMWVVGIWLYKRKLLCFAISLW